jgi:hypothetical protein
MTERKELANVYFSIRRRPLMMTPIELRQKGYQILVEHLGITDTIRFLQQMGWGRGDYTKEREKLLQAATRKKALQDLQKIRSGSGNYTEERHQWLDNVTLDEILEDIKQRQNNEIPE